MKQSYLKNYSILFFLLFLWNSTVYGTTASPKTLNNTIDTNQVIVFKNNTVTHCIDTSNSLGVVSSITDLYSSKQNFTAVIFDTNLCLNAPPIANNDIGNVIDTLVGNVLINDFDPNGDNVILNTTPILVPMYGVITLTPNGNYYYIINASNTSLIDSFRYEICDNGTPILCDTATVIINISPPVINDPCLGFTPPIDDAYIVLSNPPAPGNVLINDNYQTATTLYVSGIGHSTVNGIVTIDSTGEFTYTPNPGFVGTDYFTYSACAETSTLCCDTATVYITVISDLMIDSSVISSPICTIDSSGSITIYSSGGIGNHEYSIDSGLTWSSSNVFSNLPIGNYQTLTRDSTNFLITNNHQITAPPPPNINLVIGSDPTFCGVSNGTIIINATPSSGLMQYSIDSGATWQFSSAFTGLSGGTYCTAVRNINGTCTNFDTCLVLENLVAPTISNIFSMPAANCLIPTGSISIIATSSIGNVLEYSIDGGFSWFLSGNFNNLPCGIYQTRVRNIDGSCITSGMDITLNGNLPPNGNNDNFTATIPATPWNILTNDTDPNNHALFTDTTLITSPAYGTATLDSTGTLIYTQQAWFNGLDMLQYRVCDFASTSLCDTATVFINNGFPSVNIDSVTTIDATCEQQNGGITIYVSGGSGIFDYSLDTMQTWTSNPIINNLEAKSYDIFVRDGVDTVSITTFINMISSPVINTHTYNNDSLFLHATGQFSLKYSLDSGYTWQNSNKFHPVSATNYYAGVRYSNGLCPVINTIIPVSTPPIAVTDSVSFPQKGIKITKVLLNDYDAENNTLFVVPSVMQLSQDSITIDSNGFVYIPTEALNVGSYMMNYQVCELYNPSICTQGTLNFSISPPVDTIYTTMAIGGTQTICIPSNQLIGTPISSSMNLLCNNFYNITIDSTINDCLYLYANSYGTDTSCYAICDDLGFCDTTIIIITIEDGVWPGDTDDDTEVNNFDLLNIGLTYGQIGTTRDSVTNVWNGYITPEWNTATAVSNIDFRHADCNGDGMVNSDDTTAIALNWGEQYYRSGGGGILGGAPLFIPHNTAYNILEYKLPIHLGTSGNPATNIYGGGFSFPYDTSIFKKNSVYITFDTSWVGTQNVDMIAISKDFWKQGRLDAAFTRIDGNNISGIGGIGYLNFTIRDDILQRPGGGSNNGGFNLDSVLVSLNLTNVKFISFDETEIPVDLPTGQITITSSTNKIQLGQFIDAFPNPVSDIIRVSSEQLEINQIQLIDMTGRVIYNQNSSLRNICEIDVHTFPSGIYTLQIHTNKGLAVKRIAVVR